MREVFQGWKRKVGCLTLVMALLFLAVWLRTQESVYLVVVRGIAMPFSIMAGCGECAFVTSGYCNITIAPMAAEFSYDNPAPTRWSRPKIITLSWSARKLEVFREKPPSKAMTHGGVDRDKVPTIPFWRIVLSLTLLSAYLLLSKPDSIGYKHPDLASD